MAEDHVIDNVIQPLHSQILGAGHRDFRTNGALARVAVVVSQAYLSVLVATTEPQHRHQHYPRAWHEQPYRRNKSSYGESCRQPLRRRQQQQPQRRRGLLCRITRNSSSCKRTLKSFSFSSFLDTTRFQAQRKREHQS
ncbi:hypothetical protein E4U19_004971 [Claviceps sp. Clav32 group G5]|nr:hypothetical protein E4U19_004971 [Claviceps sp. Clav32 group G5]